MNPSRLESVTQPNLPGLSWWVPTHKDLPNGAACRAAWWVPTRKDPIQWCCLSSLGVQCHWGASAAFPELRAFASTPQINVLDGTARTPMGPSLSLYQRPCSHGARQQSGVPVCVYTIGLAVMESGMRLPGLLAYVYSTGPALTRS